MISTNNRNHDQLLKYMIGWQKGAGGFSVGEDDFKNTHFRQGWEDGRKSKMSAYGKAQKKYKAVLDVLRTK